MSIQLSAKQKEAGLSVVPKPNSMTLLSGEFTLNRNVRVVFPEEALAPEAAYLKAALSEALGGPLSVSVAAGSPTIVLQLDSGIAGHEAYSIRSSADEYKITAKTSAGIFYGIQTFLQLIPVLEANILRLPLVTINDEPRFEWRGMHLDVCRHFFSVDVVKKLIDQMARYKLNTFHWHLTDDQGWRIEIKKYPLLTEVGAWRDETVVGHVADYPHKFDGQKHGGFYTQEEIKSVVSYAQQRHITVVPEIEMPGHAQAVLAAYPEFGCFNDTMNVWPLWGVSENVFCAGKESTFEFLEDVLDEVIPLFPGAYVHVGGDECPKVNWEKCPLCQQRMKDEGCKDEHELQSYFIQRMGRYLTKNGKKLIGWDEILEGGLPENAAVMSWRGEQGGIEAAELGHKVVMTPTGWCYFDYYQSIGNNEPLAIGGLVDLAKVYSYNPVPEHLDTANQKLILGAQANLWTEYMPTVEQLEYMIYPRLCALSEVQWTLPENKNFDDFKLRLDENYLRMSKDGIHFRMPPPEGLSPVQLYQSNKAVVMLSCASPSAEIRFTTDGSEPTKFSKRYTGPLKLKLNGDRTIKAASFLKDGTRSRTLTSVLKNRELKPKELNDPRMGLNYRFYEGPFRSFAEVGGEPIKAGKVNWLVIPSEIMGKQKGWEFDGYLSVPADGSYYFQLNSNCGSGLYIGGELVINNDGMSYDCRSSAELELKAGFYPIQVNYFNSIYGQSIRLFYKRPGSDELEVFPGENYFRD
ncbi:family 20 glycosylhydrolase [Mangrovibacterium sp.]|uniref:family 20 glycosylhydrolase n=1 Tax=Mangrovibacterium sp. TaxID=1961364 RepID=UPI003561BD00